MKSKNQKNLAINLENLKGLGLDSLANLLLEACNNNLQFKERVERTLFLANDPQALVALLKKQIMRISRSTQFVSAYGSGNLARELLEIRRGIFEDLAAIAPQESVELAKKMLALHSKVFERVDDSYGEVGLVFELTLQSLASLDASENTRPKKDLAKQVYDWYCHDDYGIYHQVIRDFSQALQAEGLQELENFFRQDLEKSNTQGQNANFPSEKIISGLLDIADARGDVDGYIELLRSSGYLNSDSRIVEVAKRLLKVQRDQEVLQWLETLPNPSRVEVQSLQIEALERLGESEKAQEVRLAKFQKTLSPEVYHQCLKYSSEPERLKHQLIAVAFNDSALSQGLDFLVAIEEFAKAAELVRKHQKEWDGRNYTTLQPVAKTLESDWSLESTILYRVLIDDILARAQSKYYHHGVRYLKAIAKLAVKVSNWDESFSHEEYLAHLKKIHGRKSAFWDKCQ